MKSIKQLLAGLLLTASAQAFANVMPVIEVYNPVTLPGASVDVTHSHYQQHFFASRSGILSAFGMFTVPEFTWLTNTVRIKIGGGDSWQTDGWTALINPRLDGTLVDLTPFNLHVNAGDKVIFDVGGGGTAFMVRHGLGALFSKNNNSIYPFLHEDRSLAFTTWMIPDAVVPDEPGPPKDLPVPGAGVLMLLGLAMLGIARGLSGRRMR